VALLRESGGPWRPVDRAGFERSIASARAALGEDAFGAAWTVGQLMTLDQAIETALAETEPA
jgi:hypothetical protein